MPAYQTPSIVNYTAVTADDASPAQKQLLAFYESNNFYDAAVVPALEAYLAEQVQNQSVDIDANLALLKLYLVFPEHVDAAKVAQVLLKGITLTPSPFFTGATTLVPESVREDASVKLALEAGFLLQSCLFEDFWKLDLSFASSVAGFTDAVRAFVLEAIRKSHSVVATSVLASALHVSEKEVADVLAKEQWTLDGAVAKVPANDDNQVRPKKVQEKLEFEDVLKVIHTLSR